MGKHRDNLMSLIALTVVALLSPAKYWETYTSPSASPIAPFTAFEQRFQRALCSGWPVSLRP